MLAEFSIAPAGGGDSLSSHVARILDRVDRSGISYQLTAMGTIIEGEPDEVFALIRDCHMEMRAGASRVITTIRIDDRPGVEGALTDKVASVEKKLGRSLKT